MVAAVAGILYHTGPTTTRRLLGLLGPQFFWHQQDSRENINTDLDTDLLTTKLRLELGAEYN